MDKAFNQLKDLLVSSEVLKYPEFDKPFELHTVASNFAIGGVLMQEGRPVAYESKKLTGSQIHWPTHQKELFSVVHCLRAWKHYLGGREKTKVYTDNISIKYLELEPQVTPKELRWYDVLLAMNVELIHKPRKDNHVHDALSRKEEFMDLNVVISLRAYANFKTLTDFNRAVLEAYKMDPTAIELNEMFNYRPIPRHGLTSKFWRLRGMSRDPHGLLFRDVRLYVPQTGNVRKQVLFKFHDAPMAEHRGPDATLKAISKQFYYPGLPEDVEDYI